jgi:Ca2+-binding RTX toxin-like protein
MLIGDAANNILVGNAGNDFINGGDGCDLIIGGAGHENLIGGGGDDLIIGGSTSYDGNLAALDAILAEWQQTDIPYIWRIGHLRAGVGAGGYRLVMNQTVFDDHAGDTFSGGGGKDWFWASSFDDIIKDQKPGEQIN